ncbi:MAG: 2-iminoacetate synthase ThiH [Corallincola sp.]|nr:2-iminoacetate synthase ThiH [Corallincola sp.]
MSFAHWLESSDWQPLRRQIGQHDPAAVQAALHQPGAALPLWQALLSPAAGQQLAAMAAQSAALSRQRFGRTMRLFAPLYLSNRCSNICSYCGFSMHNAIRRLTLDREALEQELQTLHRQGFDELLLVSGESSQEVNLDYLRHAISRGKQLFRQVLIEVQPLTEADYRQLVAAGLDGVLVYQESYHRPTYASVHLKGPKRDFDWRLAAPARAAAAGVERIGLGVLLGLNDWRSELYLLAGHLRQLQQQFWRSRFQLSLPRLRPCTGGAPVAAPVSDRELVQALCALRLLAPEAGISLSTREPAPLRDQLVQLGVTQMSAGSSTQPGGYSGNGEALEQFATSDQRPLSTVAQRLQQLGLAPVWSDGRWGGERWGDERQRKAQQTTACAYGQLGQA